jgi:hypothetical protein
MTWLAVLAVLLAGTGTATLLHETTHAFDASAPTAMDCSGCPVDSSDSAPADDHEGDDCPTCDFLKTLTAATPAPVSVAMVEPDGIWLASVVHTPGTQDVRSCRARAPPITIV